MDDGKMYIIVVNYRILCENTFQSQMNHYFSSLNEYHYIAVDAIKALI